MKKISVCMATFNGENYIHEQIKSILNQLSPIDELIISDDHSTDKTIAIVKSFNDERIKIVFNKNAKGSSGNFENAIEYACGEFIFLSDQDDIWVDGKVNKMLCMLNHVELVVSNAQFVDKDLKPSSETYFSLRGGKKGFINNIYYLRYLGACMAFKREILRKLLPFPKDHVLCPHDMWIALIAEFYFKVDVIAEPLILYRRHETNVSDGGRKSGNSIFKMILFRLYAMSMLLTRMLK